jgi:tRNA dimethylallyltransferase
MVPNLIVILGATASGKTQMAARLAYELQGEIISADSRQVYKGMDIGTGKDLKEYTINDYNIPYHLIDIVSPREEFNLFEFQTGFYEIYQRLVQKEVLPVMVGGTGLYLESVIAGYYLPEAPPDEELRGLLKTKTVEELQQMLLDKKKQLHNKTDLENKDRLIRAIEIEKARGRQPDGNCSKSNISAVVFGIHRVRSELRQRITARLKQRLEQGMVEEVKALQMSGLTWSRLEGFGLEYRYIARYLQDKISYNDMFMKLNTGIHQFAKRQETWFRRMEKKGITINWINGDDYNLLKESVIKHLNE